MALSHSCIFFWSLYMSRKFYTYQNLITLLNTSLFHTQLSPWSSTFSYLSGSKAQFIDYIFQFFFPQRFFSHYLHQWGKFFPVCMLVCLLLLVLATSSKKLCTDLDEILKEGQRWQWILGVIKINAWIKESNWKCHNTEDMTTLIQWSVITAMHKNQYLKTQEQETTVRNNTVIYSWTWGQLGLSLSYWNCKLHSDQLHRDQHANRRHRLIIIHLHNIFGLFNDPDFSTWWRCPDYWGLTVQVIS